jgi:hypothetical protein
MKRTENNLTTNLTKKFHTKLISVEKVLVKIEGGGGSR